MDLQQRLLEVTQTIEKHVDAAIEEMQNIDAEALEGLRQKRIKEMKEREVKIIEWKKNGHGAYEELAEEKLFFDTIKNSERVVLHFYKYSNERCRIVDMHLKALAPKHIEARFVKLNAEKSPFITEKLKIKVLPCIVSIHNGILVDKIVGFTTLGNTDNFTTDHMEWRLAQNDFLEYEGDLSTEPSECKQGNKKAQDNGKIRNGFYDGDDDDLHIEGAITMPTLNYELTAEEEAELGL